MRAAISSAGRRQAYLLGMRAETAAALLLRLKGFRILARRFKAHVGEVDLVARRGRLLVFAEVKARASLDVGLESIRPRQQARILRGAEAYLARHPQIGGLDMRFDVIVVAPGALPRHLAGAFESRR